MSVTRYRQKGQCTARGQFQYIKANSPDAGVIETHYAPAELDYTEMTDVVTDHFHKRSANGELIFNPMTKHEIRSSGTYTTYKLVDTGEPNPPWGGQKGYTHIITGNLFGHLCGAHQGSLRQNGGTDYRLAVTSGADDASRAIAEACTMAQTIPSDASLLVTLAETQKTLRLLPDLLHAWRKPLMAINARETQLQKALSRGRQGNPGRNAMMNLRDIEVALEQTWLMARFGLRPLVMDTLGCMKAFSRVHSMEKRRVTTRGKSSVTISGSSSTPLGYGIVRTPCTESTTEQITVRAMCMWEAQVTALLDDLGINLAHVPEAVIDLTRFSFVLNWVVNVNDFALALGSSIQPGWEKLGGCYVTRRETNTIYQASGSYIQSGGTPAWTTRYNLVGSLGGTWLCTDVSTSRTKGLVPPKFTVRADAMKWATDFRLLDAATLLRQQIRGRGVSLLNAVSRRGRKI